MDDLTVEKIISFLRNSPDWEEAPRGDGWVRFFGAEWSFPYPKFIKNPYSVFFSDNDSALSKKDIEGIINTLSYFHDVSAEIMIERINNSVLHEESK